MIKPFILLLVNTMLFLHDFHVSHTTLYYNKNEESIEISIRVAIDDLEKTLQTNSSGKLNLGNQKENKSSEKYIKNYFKSHLQISLNEKKVTYKWIGKEIAKDLHDIYLFFEISDCHSDGNIESIGIENTLFLERYEKQSNIVLIEFGVQSYNINFTKDYIKESIIL